MRAKEEEATEDAVDEHGRRVTPDGERLDLSVVVLAWNNLSLTRAFVESVRQNTDVPYELVIVDNGSESEAAEFARSEADRPVLNPSNLGFAAGMNRGLRASRGAYVAFCNNDTVLPPAWASRLVATALEHPNAAIVVPAITTASNPVTVRSEPGTDVEVLEPFSAPPAAVVYLMPRALMATLGGWEEEYEVASAEDVDLGFKVWVNDLDIVYDQRVLVDHVGHATASKLAKSQQRWIANRRRFLDKWMGDTDPPLVGSCDPDRFARNRATARSVAEWMNKYFTIRDRRLEQELRAAGNQGSRSRVRQLASRARRRLRRFFAY